MTQRSPIGVFDSGFGGLTIFRKIRGLLPAYDYLYLGDNARAPYGNRSFETVYAYTLEAVQYLFSQNCPLVILACNTASAKALRSIQQNWLPHHYPDRRVLGVIRPTVEVIHQHTHSKQVALWATTGTVKSDSFRLEIEKYAPGVNLYQQACPLLVPLVESGELQGKGLEYFVQKYWEQTHLAMPGADTLLLACTHYPLLLPVIRKMIPASVNIVAQDSIVAPSLKDYLERHPETGNRLSIGGTAHYLTTEQEGYFDELARVFMGESIQSEKVVL